jgi:hypothetical protein
MVWRQKQGKKEQVLRTRKTQLILKILSIRVRKYVLTTRYNFFLFFYGLILILLVLLFKIF